MNYKKEWDKLGEMDPLWAVLSDPTKRFNGWDESEFFVTGQKEIDVIMQKVNTFDLPKETKKVLDFGCGVGRLTKALSQHFDDAVGVDVSKAMIEKAKKLHEGDDKQQFIVNQADDLSMFKDDTFDMVYCNIVLQHIPDKNQIERYIGEFIRVLRPGGVIAFQVPSKVPFIHRLQPKRRVYQFLSALGFSHELLYNRLKLYPIQMNWLPQERVEAFLQGKAKLLEAANDTSAGELIESRMYYVTK
ncbi:class I SAM-dependent methyltransferase [Candidatus Nomurabacteria bacterium]|nr:class I SAM-dependent methyltransferase [Candidatus Nomurabacteria bacterium]